MKFNKYILAVIALLAASFALEAQTFQSKSFLNGCNLAVTSTSTNTYSGTNTYANGFITTNSGSGYLPVARTNTAAFGDVDLWVNSDGSLPSTSINVAITGLNASFTNTGLFKFATVPDFGNQTSNPYLTNIVQTAASFTFSITGNGTTAVCISTNVPTALLQGQRRLRCTSIEWTNAGTNGVVAGLSFSGYTPK